MYDKNDNKYLYFRAQATIGDDQDANDSCCFPASSLVGMVPSNDSTLQLYFHSMQNNDGFANGSNEIVVSDFVNLTLATDNTHKETMEAILNTLLSPKDGIIVIGDNLTGATEYCTPLISAVGSITIKPANS
jgi:hypothetical protein